MTRRIVRDESQDKYIYIGSNILQTVTEVEKFLTPNKINKYHGTISHQSSWSHSKLNLTSLATLLRFSHKVIS